MFDQADEVLLVAAGVGRVLILVPLPPDKAGDLTLVGTGVIRANVGQNLFGIGHIIIILFSSIPWHRLFGFTFHPGKRVVFIAGIGLAFKSEPLAAGRQKIPAKAAVSDAGFENQHWFLQDLSHDVTELQFRPNGPAFDGQPVVVQQHHPRPFLHDLNIPDIASRGPKSGVIHQVGKLLFRFR